MLKRVIRLYSMARDSRSRMIAGLLFSAVSNLLMVILSANLYGDVVRSISAGNPMGIAAAFLRAVPLLLGLLLCEALASYLQERATSLASAGMRKNLMLGMLTGTLAHSLKRDSGTKLSYFSNDVPVATNSLCDALYIPIRAIVMGIGGFGYILFVCWQLAAIMLGIGALVLLFSIICSNQLYRASAKVQKSLAVMSSELKNHLDGILVARIDGMRDHFENRFLGASKQAVQDGITKAKISAVLGALNNFSSGAGQGLIIFAAGLLFLGGAMDFPTMFQVSEMANSAIYIFFVARSLVAIQECLAGAQRVFDELDSLEPERSGALSPEEGEPVVRLEDVSFGYSDNPDILRGLSFTVQKGELVALTGRSGSGKTSVLRLIQGLYLPRQGKVEVNAADVRSWDLRALRRRTALVSQDHMLFTGTIAENIALGTPGATREQIVQAAKDAGIHDLILSLPQGYDSPVEEKGHSLSGGQRQRIAIARALLSGAPILLLDEVTSALDPQSDELILKTLKELKGKKTILMVAHKQNAIQIADRCVDVSKCAPAQIGSD